MNEQVFTVSDFISLTNQTLEYAFSTVTIEGEVSSFKINSGKYVFFDLKDDESSLGCFMTIWQLRTPIEDGMKVVIVGMPKLTKWGKFSLTVQNISPSGVGSIKKSFELLKEKLSKEGLFDESRKRQIPYPPKSIGVISSIQAAGYVDFITILNERWGGIEIKTANVQVQGINAADQIIRAIKHFNSQSNAPDVIAIVRGGGSLDDLSVFNDELLVREIAISRIPTIVGVGHEIDLSLSDLVADVRASTPSNAAQLLVPDRIDAIKSLEYKFDQIKTLLKNRIDEIIYENNQILNRIWDRIDTKVENIENYIKTRLEILNAFNPAKVLERGYAILHGEIKLGKMISIHTNKHKIKAVIKELS